MVGGKQKYEREIPVVDEGWWASVLAEESRYTAHAKVEVEKEASSTTVTDTATQETVNWNQIKDIYMNDRIVALSVTGHNRGG